MGNFKKYIIRKRGILGILAPLFYQCIIIVTMFCVVTINSLLFVDYVKLYKAFRPGNKYMERTEQIIEILSFRSHEQ